jgi:hypothetical protein
LCVSQLGNDTESKTQLKESIREIGRLLAERGSSAAEQRVRRIKADLRGAREEQAKLHHAILGWAALASATITIDAKVITAQQAAQECDASRAEHDWLPDTIEPESEPPLSGTELKELCALLAEVSAEDHESSLQSLPDPGQLQSPGEVAQMFAARHAASNRATQSQADQLSWGAALKDAGSGKLEAVVDLVEAALTSLNDIESEWQLRLLDLMTSDPNQRNFWTKLFQTCDSLYQRAFGCHQKTYTHEISTPRLPSDLDADTALREIRSCVAKGRSPASILGA